MSDNSIAVSVVMSVFDRPDHVRKTIESVLEQSHINFELIIVDDGAVPSVKSILSEYVNEPRVVIIEQNNQGLTKALIRACALSRYEYIARIDAGDTMVKNRLSTQAQLLECQQDIGVVCSWVKVVTEEGYFLYEVKHVEANLHADVLSHAAENITTPFHSSVMFRKSVYLQVGGYRSEFYFAQDCDLWARMSRVSKMGVISQTLTIGLFSYRGLSGRYADLQNQLKGLVAEANKLRSKALSDVDILQKAQKLRPKQCTSNSTLEKTDFPALYFIASCLNRNKSKYAKNYWLRVISIKPFNLKALIKLLMSLMYLKAEK